MTIRSQVVVHLVLVGMRVCAHRGDLVGLLVFEPCVDEVLREDVALGEEFVVLAQRIEGCLERTGQLRDVLAGGSSYRSLSMGAAGSMRRLIPSMPAMRHAENAR